MPKVDFTATSKRKRGRPIKNKNGLTKSLPNDWEKDFVFPVTLDTQEHPSTPSPMAQSLRAGKNTRIQEYKNIEKRKSKKNKNTSILSSHVLDLRQPIKQVALEKVELAEMPPVFNYPTFNADDWFSNFIERQNISPVVTRKVDFELPEQPEVPVKIEFYKPPRTKIKSRVKINFGQDVGRERNVRVKNFSSLDSQKSIGWFIIKKFLKFIWFPIVLPFKVLDFLVDRTLKIIWWLIKFIILNFLKFIKIFLSNLKTIFTRPYLKTGEAEVWPQFFSHWSWRINYKPILSFALICLIIILPLQIFNLKQKSSLIKGQVLGQSIAGLESLKDGSLLGKNFDFESAGKEFAQAYFSFKIAESYLDNLDIFSRELIKLVPEAKEADNLLIIGQLAAQLGQDLTGLAENLARANSAENDETKIIKKIQLTSLTLNQIEPYILELLERVNKIDFKLLNKYVEEKNLEKLALFQKSLPLLKQNFDQLKTLNQFLSDFLGASKSQKYLVIFQNNSELRPTGGFMGSYALIEIKKGKIVQLEVPAGGFYDLKAATQIRVEAPKPFQLFSPYWQIWNANWFPDWPASAQKIAWFYESSLGGVTVDGVIALTPNVLEDLLKITGQIEMPDYQKIITADNFVREVQMATEVEYDKEENQPKKIIADLMPKILERVFNLTLEQTPAFLSALNNNLAQKNILAWFKDESRQGVVQNFSWSGEIKRSQSDYLMVVHTNIGGGKTDRVIKNKILHEVVVDEQGNIFETVTLTRNHLGDPKDIFEGQNNVDYVRFYVPLGSELIEASNFDYLPYNLFKAAANQKELARDSDLERIEKNPILDERFNMRITEEFGKTVFGNWLQVKPGQEKTVTLKYKLPFKLSKVKENFFDKIINFVKISEKPKVNYNLVVQKQPGLAETDFISRLNLPSEFQIIDYSLAKNKLTKNGNLIIYQDNLNTDGYYQVEME